MAAPVACMVGGGKRTGVQVRIIAGEWRGRVLAAPPGEGTRPTAERMRQALFDMLMHAPWAGRAIADAEVLDAFAGTGALGLEALSRGAARAHFIETERHALEALRANVAACKAGDRAVVIAGDALRPKPGVACGLVFLDPPYGKDFVPKALASLGRAGWIASGALVIAETGRDEVLELPGEKLAERAHGAAVVTAWRIS
jgi:16S rRNA (guanine966-N2)-methyltransferase